MPRRRLTLLAALAALTAAGCGGDDEPSTAQTGSQASPPAETVATEPAQTTEQEPTAPDETPAVVAREKRALERDGFEVRDSGVGGIGGAQGALEMPLKGGGALTVIAFETREAAEQHAEQFREAAEKSPDYIQLDIRDTTLFLGIAEPPEKLSRASFDAAVEAAAGAR